MSNNPRKILAEIAAEGAKKSGDSTTDGGIIGGDVAGGDAAGEGATEGGAAGGDVAGGGVTDGSAVGDGAAEGSTAGDSAATPTTAPASAPESAASAPATTTSASGGLASGGLAADSPSAGSPSSNPLAVGSSAPDSLRSDTLASGSLRSGDLADSQSLGGKPKTRTTDKRIKPANDERLRKQRRKRRLRIIRNTAIIIVLLLAIGTIVGFWMFRWGMYDDVADIQGKWRISGSDTIVSISDDKFVLTDDIAYEYEIDPQSKTISFEFGALDGDARYRFSVDRQRLAVEDGEFDEYMTLSSDIPWTFDALLDELKGTGSKSPAFYEGGMLLERVE